MRPRLGKQLCQTRNKSQKPPISPETASKGRPAARLSSPSPSAQRVERGVKARKRLRGCHLFSQGFQSQLDAFGNTHILRQLLERSRRFLVRVAQRHQRLLNIVLVIVIGKQ